MRSDHRTLPRTGFVPAALVALVMAFLLLGLAGCGQHPSFPEQHAIDIDKGDVCAVCGMYIEAGPGPRAEAYVQGYKAPLKFGSTRDFFAYVLQPENKSGLQHLFVQDSARIDWTHPSNSAQTFVDARTAYYVAWQPLRGLMGPTFASFGNRREAETFVTKHGGEILRFDDITPELTSMLGYACPSKGSAAFRYAKNCSQ